MPLPCLFAGLAVPYMPCLVAGLAVPYGLFAWLLVCLVAGLACRTAMHIRCPFNPICLRSSSYVCYVIGHPLRVGCVSLRSYRNVPRIPWMLLYRIYMIHHIYNHMDAIIQDNLGSHGGYFIRYICYIIYT